jgi:hypothetical protein
MYAIATNNIMPIRNYEQADKHFNGVNKPRTLRWSSHQRPLRNTQSRHIRLEKGELNGVPFYDCMLYSTPLVRYFKPNENNESAVWLGYDSSQSSSKFMSRMGWYNGMGVNMDDGGVGHVVFATSTSFANTIWGDEFTAKLVINSAGRVVRDKSHHIPIFRKASTPTMRARRKKLREQFEVMFAMMEMQFPEMVREHKLSTVDGEPFARLSLAHYTPNYYAASKSVRKLAEGETLTPDEATELTHFVFDLGRQTTGNIMNRRFYHAVVNPNWNGDRFTRKDFFNNRPVSAQPEDIQAAVTPTFKDVSYGAMKILIELSPLDADDRVPYPQMPESMPKSYYGADPSRFLDNDTYSKLVNRKGVIY